MTSPPNTTGWNSARSNFTNFAQVNSSTPTSTPIHLEETITIRNNTASNNNKNNSSSGEMQVLLERSARDEYYSTHYSPSTGLRIATTLGSFFLFVLLTLLYKSKCKKHSSRCPSPILPLLQQLPTTSAINNTADFIHHQVHPYINNNSSYDFCPPPFLHPPHPALLLTSANSDSSDEELSSSTKPLCSVTRYLQSGSAGGRQSIDIHVILPTPTISPSSSEHFRGDLGNPQPPLPGQHHIYLHDRRRSSASSSTGTPFTGSPFTFPDNLKYVDDTSSENIPECRDGLGEEEDDEQSLGSDSVFTCCEPPPPPLPPKRRPSTSPSYYSGLEEEWRVTLTQAQAQVHHRDSFASDLESVNDYLEGNNSSGGAGSGTNSRRRSSSTQTTLSDLQHCLGLATYTSGIGGNVTAGIGGIRSPSPRLSPNRPHPHHFMSLRQSPVQFLAAPNSGGGGGGNISPRVKGGRKRSVDALLLVRREQQQQQQLQLNRFSSGTTSPSLDIRRHHHPRHQDNFELVQPDK